MFALIVAAVIYKADVAPGASLAADTFFKQLVYYALLTFAAYNATRFGDLDGRHLVTALLISVWATVIFKVVFTGLGPVPHGLETGRVGGLFYGRKFAYLAVVGFTIHFVRSLSTSSTSRSRALSAVLAFCLLFLIALSLLRAAWLATFLVVLFVPAFIRRRSWWVAIPLALILALSVPLARARLIPSVDAPTDITTGRYALWTNVWTDDVVPALPWGNGFGHAWTLTPQEVFGFSTFQFGDVESDRFLYLHSALLFWLVEFGVWGVALFILFWKGLLSAILRLLQEGDPIIKEVTLTLLGVVAAMAVAQIVGSGYSFRALAERFFVVSGFVFGLNALTRSRREFRQNVSPMQQVFDPGLQVV